MSMSLGGKVLARDINFGGISTLILFKTTVLHENQADFGFSIWSCFQYSIGVMEMGLRKN